mgnify:CR=1 FL=1
MSSRRPAYFIVPLTEEAEEWIHENILNPSYQREGLTVEGQYIDAIIKGMLEAGLREEEDFCLRF